MKCKSGNHDLIVIYSEPIPDHKYYYVEIVRWCKYCGAVVVDQEHDGRLLGQSVPMKFSELMYKMWDKDV